MTGGLDITLIGTSGFRWPVHSELSNTRHVGMTLAHDSVSGLIDTPIETEWIEDTDRGAVFAGVRYLPRDVGMGFFFADDLSGIDIGRLESDFRMDFAIDPDPWDANFRHAQVEVKSQLSGARTLTIQLREAPEMKTVRDPYSHRFYDIGYELRAGEPLWYSGTEVTSFQRTSTNGTGTIAVSNPTDVPMRHTIVLTRANTWTIPDVQWVGPRGARTPGGPQGNRTIRLPRITEQDQGVRLTRERRKLHAATFTGSNFQSRMLGNILRFDIPPYTPRTILPISYTGAPSGGARAEFHQPRLWSRPVGLELTP